MWVTFVQCPRQTAELIACYDLPHNWVDWPFNYMFVYVGGYKRLLCIVHFPREKNLRHSKMLVSSSSSLLIMNLIRNYIQLMKQFYLTGNTYTNIYLKI